MVRSGVDGSAAGATAAMPDAANCEPSPDGDDVAGFREADVHLRSAFFFPGVIEFFLRSSDTLAAPSICCCAIEILIFSLFFFFFFFTTAFRVAPLSSFFTPFVRLSSPYDDRYGFLFFFCLLFFFLFCSAALYSRMFIWRICIIYACCGTPLGSAL